MGIEHQENGQKWKTMNFRYYELPELNMHFTASAKAQKERPQEAYQELDAFAETMNSIIVGLEETIGEDNDDVDILKLAKEALMAEFKSGKHGSIVLMDLDEKVSSGEFFSDEVDVALRYKDIGVEIFCDHGRRDDQFAALHAFRSQFLKIAGKDLTSLSPEEKFKKLKMAMTMVKQNKGIKVRIKGEEYRKYTDKEVLAKYAPSVLKKDEKKELTIQEQAVQAQRLEKIRLTDDEKIAKGEEWELEEGQTVADFREPLKSSGELVIEEVKSEISECVYEILFGARGLKKNNAIILQSESREKLNNVVGDILKTYSPKQWQKLKKNTFMRDHSDFLKQEGINYEV